MFFICVGISRKHNLANYCLRFFSNFTKLINSIVNHSLLYIHFLFSLFKSYWTTGRKRFSLSGFVEGGLSLWEDLEFRPIFSLKCSGIFNIMNIVELIKVEDSTIFIIT